MEAQGTDYRHTEVLDNVGKTVKDDLAASIDKGDKLSIAAACFSMYAYQALKKQLDGIAELRFIFTSPTFLKEKAPREKREFYIPRLDRERSLYGTEFEVKLRNELTQKGNELTQKAVARECADWIRKKVQFRSNRIGGNISSFMNVVGAEGATYAPFNGFTTADIGCERGNNINNFVHKVSPVADEYVRSFDQAWDNKELLQDVTDSVLDSITAAYNENTPEFIYFVAIYNIFNEFLADISEDVLPNEATGFKESKIWNMLYNFQKDAVLAIINKLADSTTGVTAGETIQEIQVFEIQLRQRTFDRKVLPAIPETIPYKILFVLTIEDKVLGDKAQAWIEASGTFYHTDWQPNNEFLLKFEGLNLDTVYENLARQIAKGRLGTDDSIEEAVDRDKQRQKLERKIAALKKKMPHEKQFNKQIKLNNTLKQLKKELEELDER